jgi:hypothetical protein
MVTWADDFNTQTAPTSLISWQPSFIPKPENIADRWTDWYDGGTESAKYIQGFLLHCDTGNVVKGMAVYDSDTLTAHPFTPAVQHNGESIKAYSFNTPFIAHMVRLQPSLQTTTVLGPYAIAASQQQTLPPVFIVTLNAPLSSAALASLIASYGVATATFAGLTAGAGANGQTYVLTFAGNTGTGAYAGFGQLSFEPVSIGPSYPQTADTGTVSVTVEATGGVVLWRFFDVEWIFEATPEMAETWGPTQGTSFGFNGYSHIQRIVAAYAATEEVTVTIRAFDGTSPAVITLPATGGAYQKLLQVLTFNKGQLYFFAATSPAQFQLYLDDWEVLVGHWGRQDGYLTWKSLGAPHGVKATI